MSTNVGDTAGALDALISERLSTVTLRRAGGPALGPGTPIAEPHGLLL